MQPYPVQYILLSCLLFLSLNSVTMSKLLIRTRGLQNNICQKCSAVQWEKPKPNCPKIHNYDQQEPWNANVIKQQAGRLLSSIF